MRMPKLFYSFRWRLLLVMAALLVATLLVQAGETTRDIRELRPASPPLVELPDVGEPRAFPIPVETSTGRNYVIVVLGAAKTPENDSWQDIVAPLLPTLTVILLATLASTFLVWRFTRPVEELARATRRVAAGDLSFRVPSANRRDEVGELA